MSMATIMIYLAGMASGWFVFRKMGRKGWEGMIPFYNNYVICEVLYNSGWKSLLLLIPFYNIYVWFKMNIDLAVRFNQEKGFGVGMSFFPAIFRAIIAFNDSFQFEDGRYSILNKDIVDEISGGMKFNTNDTEQLMKYKNLYETGVISKDEYELKKKKILKID